MAGDLTPPVGPFRHQVSRPRPAFGTGKLAPRVDNRATGADLSDRQGNGDHRIESAFFAPGPQAGNLTGQKGQGGWGLIAA